MRWTWDENKNRINTQKHGLSFETAQLVFDAPLMAHRPDPHADEERWHTKGEPMKKGASRKLTKAQQTEVQALAALPDEQIDTSDIPEILDWSGARRNLLYRPVKRQITLRLDADVVAWFKANAPDGRGYQTEINRVLREHATSPRTEPRRSD